MKGLFAWIGFPQTAVRYKRDPRFAGVTKFNYWKLWNFALEGITSFTIAPLKIAAYLGAVIAFAAFLYSTWIVYKTLMFGDGVFSRRGSIVVHRYLRGIYCPNV